MIALLGQTVRDEIVHADGSEEIRCGGAPVFAAHALASAGIRGMVITKGGDDALHADLSRRGLPVLIGPADDTFVSRLILKEHGERDHELASLGEPFTPVDVEGWARSSLENAATIVIGTQWRGDVPPETLRAIHALGRRIVFDAQGLARPGLGEVVPSGPLDPAWLTGVDAVKFSDEEAQALLGGTDATALARAGVPIVLVTYGEGGVDVWSLDEPDIVRVPADRIPRLADTVGAGDMFTALFAAALDQGEAPRAAARAATHGVAEILRLRV
jgi:sugar/nucleoside kinase (ribokinase family)